MAAGVKIGGALLLAVVLAAGCGIKGSLEPPPEAKADKAAKANSGQGKKEGEAPRPHRDFLLDGLIR